MSKRENVKLGLCRINRHARAEPRDGRNRQSSLDAEESLGSDEDTIEPFSELRRR
jgi:hypothetical protein